MENKQFPEEERNLPQTEDTVPAEPEAPEILDIPFAPAGEFLPEEVVVSEDAVAEEAVVTEEAAAEEVTAEEEIPAAEIIEEEISAAETVVEDIPQETEDTGAIFMAQIPSVEEDYSLEPAEEAVIDPVSESEVQGNPADDAEDLELSRLLEEEAALPAVGTPEEEIADQEYRDNGKDFDEMFHAPAAEKKPPENVRPARKGRPKRKKGEGLLGIPNILATFVWLALIVAIGVTAGRMLWVCAADVLAFGREDRVVTVTIYEADTMEDIVDKLHRNGLIRYKSLFNLYASISDAEEDIKPGIYDLNTRYDYHALVNFMSPRSSRTIVENLLIPEGYTCQQIFELLEEKRVCTAVDLAAYAASGELKDYWFLDGVERGSEYCLEGYLFPDTYDFYKNSSPREVLEKLLDNFDYRFSEEMRAQIETLNANVTGGGYTVREITIVASLIEKESASPEESPKVSGVIYNRLFNWGSNPAYLNIDASIVYALGGKSDLTREDLQIDSPYNTYTNIGLTPGPIANPGLSSLKAALNPESHNYYYYVLNPATGNHQFSTTYDEHSANVARFAEGS